MREPLWERGRESPHVEGDSALLEELQIGRHPATSEQSTLGAGHGPMRQIRKPRGSAAFSQQLARGTGINAGHTVGRTPK